MCGLRVPRGPEILRKSAALLTECHWLSTVPRNLCRESRKALSLVGKATAKRLVPDRCQMPLSTEGCPLYGASRCVVQVSSSRTQWTKVRRIMGNPMNIERRG